MADFEKLCKVIIMTNGKPSENDVLDAGYSNEHYERISKADPNRLVRNARDGLIARGKL